MPGGRTALGPHDRAEDYRVNTAAGSCGAHRLGVGHIDLRPPQISTPARVFCVSWCAGLVCRGTYLDVLVAGKRGIRRLGRGAGVLSLCARNLVGIPSVRGADNVREQELGGPRRRHRRRNVWPEPATRRWSPVSPEISGPPEISGGFRGFRAPENS